MKNEDPIHPEGPTSALFPSVNRRQFLKTLGGGIVITFSLRLPAIAQHGPSVDQKLPDDWNAFIRIGTDGRITCYTGKIEMGQGIITSFARIAAEELDIDPARVDMVMGDTDLCPRDQGTFGSRSTKYFGPALRSAAAEARAVLIRLASERLGIPAENLFVQDGVILSKGNQGKQVTYAELAGGQRINKHIDPKPQAKPVSRHTVSGKPALRADSLEKVTGRTKYTGDIRLPGMVYARVLRPPVHGARLKSADTSGAEKISGLQVIREGDFIAVLHSLPDVAASAIETIRAEWDSPESKVDGDTIYRHMAGNVLQGEEITVQGEVEKGKSLSRKTFEAVYYVPYVAHAPMETHSAVAKVEGGRATVWASTQRPFGARNEVADLLGFAVENVRIITPHLGGGFGAKSRNGQVIEAARLAKLSGKPVQVVWSREEEFFNDTFQPAAFVTISSGLNDAGKMVFWDYQVCFAGDRASQLPYNSPHVRIISHGNWSGAPGVHPFGVGAWRGPGANTNNFARESHIDVMAVGAGADPLEFRFAHLKEKRMRRVLEAAAERFGWTPSRAPSGKGQGVACTDYLGTCVAAMAEVKVDRRSGNIAVKRIVCAQDMGEIINPQGAGLQIEGCAVMGLGYALREQLQFRGGEILDLNFDTYEIPRFSWLPKIEVILVDNPELPPQGCGEPAITCMGAVIANAVFDASGARINQLPLTPDRVKKALPAV